MIDWKNRIDIFKDVFKETLIAIYVNFLIIECAQKCYSKFFRFFNTGSIIVSNYCYLYHFLVLLSQQQMKSTKRMIQMTKIIDEKN